MADALHAIVTSRAIREALEGLATQYPKAFTGLAETGTVKLWKDSQMQYATVSDELRTVVLLQTVTGEFIPWIY